MTAQELVGTYKDIVRNLKNLEQVAAQTRPLYVIRAADSTVKSIQFEWYLNEACHIPGWYLNDTLVKEDQLVKLRDILTELFPPEVKDEGEH